MAKKIDEKLLQKERDSLEQDLIAARANVERSKNQVQAILGAIQMTDRLIALSKEGNYSRSRANSDGVPEEKGLPVNVGKTVRSATSNKGVKKITKERDGVKIHYFEEDDGKG